MLQLSDLDNILGKLDEEPAPVAKIEDIPLPLVCVLQALQWGHA